MTEQAGQQSGPEQPGRPRSIKPGEVTPGMHLWNPYGGRLGHFVAASQARVAPDGNVEIDLADGRVGRYRPNFQLHVDWTATDAEVAAREARRGVYEREGETYRAHRINGPDDGPAMADYLVRRDSDGRFGGYIVDLAADGDEQRFGPDACRFEVYDDRGRLIAPTQSLLGALSIFAQPDRSVRWISDRLPAHPDNFEPEVE